MLAVYSQLVGEFSTAQKSFSNSHRTMVNELQTARRNKLHLVFFLFSLLCSSIAHIQCLT